MTKEPSIAEVCDFHRRLAPSQEAYNVIYKHCEVIATLAEILAHHANVKRAEKLGLSAQERDTICCPSGCVDVSAPYAVVEGGEVPSDFINEKLAYIGGLLHDIGTYSLLLEDGSHGKPLKFDGPRYILHGVIGYNIALAEYGVNMAQFCRNHTGVGLTREDVIKQQLPLEPADYLPTTLEQEVVMVADKYNSKSVPPEFLTVHAYTRKAARFGEQNKERWLAYVRRYGRPEIELLAAHFGMAIRT